MVTSVNTAFNKFIADKVNIDPADTKEAREDRAKLRSRIRKLQNSVSGFPVLAPSFDIDFGSFSRRTKKRPLDDVDIFVGLHGQGASYLEEPTRVTVSANSGPLSEFAGPNDDIVSSIKVLNKIKKGIDGIYEYRGADVNRRQEAVVVSVNKPWGFDVVPCFHTRDVEPFYLIPDGCGHWKKANPKVDRDRVTKINQQHSGNMLNIIRVVKYWNKRATMPSIYSYLLECMMLEYYENKLHPASSFVDIELPRIFEYLSNAVFNVVSDPKGFSSDLNTLSLEDKLKISLKANSDFMKANEARRLEESSPSGTHRECINKWREIFGPEFPAYG